MWMQLPIFSKDTEIKRSPLTNQVKVLFFFFFFFFFFINILEHKIIKFKLVTNDYISIYQ